MFEEIKPTPQEAMEAQRAIDLAVRAREIFDNPAYLHAKKLIEQSCIEKFKNPSLTSAEREMLWLYWQMFDRLDATIEATLHGESAAKLILETFKKGD